MNSDVKLSVFCLTYNHSEYIRDAIESFLMQKANFKYNIFVFDDASTDGTSDILVQYKKKYPEIMDIFIAPCNTYNSPDRSILLKKLYNQFLKGKYVAWCEGDDYWIDELKLQKQVDFLENNTECSMVTHSFEILNCVDNTFSIKKFRGYDDYLSPEEIILQPMGNLATASLVMRKAVFLRDNGFPKCDVEDVPMQLCALNMGKVYYMHEVMSVYRYMHKGSWSMDNALDVNNYIQHLLKFVEFLKRYNIFTSKKFDTLIWKKIITYLYVIVEKANKFNIKVVTSSEKGKKNLLNQINKVLGWFNGNPKLTEEEISNLRNCKKIYIMGKGKYSRFVKKSLDGLQCKIDGYVVSKKESRIAETDIHQIDEVTNDRSVIIIVGISQNKEDEILQIMKAREKCQFMRPLWFEKEEILNE